MNVRILLFVLLVICSQNCQNKENSQPIKFDVNSAKAKIIERGKVWGQAIQNKDISLISDLYDEDAHYLPDAENALHGNKAITEYWQNSFSFLQDLQLNMETLNGEKDLLCETGKGLAMFPNQIGGTDTLRFKYMNAWKLNDDGKYRVVIDIYNDIKRTDN